MWYGGDDDLANDLDAYGGFASLAMEISDDSKRSSPHLETERYWGRNCECLIGILILIFESAAHI